MVTRERKTRYVSERIIINYEKIDTVIKVLEELRERIPEEFRDRTELQLNCYDDSVEEEVLWPRWETDEEMADRIKADEESKRVTEQRMRQQYEELKKMFEGEG